MKFKYGFDPSKPVHIGPQDPSLVAHPDNRAWFRAQLDPIVFEELAGQVEIPGSDLQALQDSNNPMARMLFNAARKLGALDQD